MLKKTLLVGAGAVLIVGLLFGRSAVTYVKTVWNDVQTGVSDAIPTETKIKMVKQEIKDLDTVISKLAHQIAKEELKLERMGSEVGEKEQELVSSYAQIMKLKEHLENNSQSQFVATDGKRHSTTDVEIDLRNRFANYKTQKSTVAKLARILDERQKGLDANREQYTKSIELKHEFEVKVEELMARQKMLEVEQSTSTFEFNDSQIKRVQSMIDDIEGRIQVNEKLNAMDSKEGVRIQLDEVETDASVSEDLVDQVNSYFNEEVSEYVEH